MLHLTSLVNILCDNIIIIDELRCIMQAYSVVRQENNHSIFLSWVVLTNYLENLIGEGRKRCDTLAMIHLQKVITTLIVNIIKMQEVVQ
jgi:hypothetical protein